METPLPPSGPPQEEWERYLREESTPSTLSLAKQMLTHGPLKNFVVLTPVLATTDLGFLKNYVEQYAKQTTRGFTVVVFPNASLEVDPEQEAVAACKREVEALAELHPHLDLRVVTDPEPPEVFTSIGNVRKTLWDAAADAALTSKALKEADRAPISSETIEMLSEIAFDYIFINHDVDVIFIPRSYMKTYLTDIAYYELYSRVADRPAAYNSTMSHAREESKPHASSVVAVYDYSIASVANGFEAGLAIPLTTYITSGGFRKGDYTYEVAGFVNRSGRIAFVPNSALLTSPRRVHYRLHETSVRHIWGNPAEGTQEDFNETDPCRFTPRGDITRERADELILEWEREVRFPSYIITQAVDRFARYRKNEEYAILQAVVKATTLEENEAAWEAATPYLEKEARLASEGFRKVLTASGFTKTDELMERIKLDVLLEVRLFIRQDQARFKKLTPVDLPQLALQAPQEG